MLPKLSILAILLWTAGCNDELFEYNKLETFDDLHESISRYSASIASRNINWDSLIMVYRAEISEGMTEREYYETISKLLLEFRDPHVWLISPFESMYSIDHLGYTRNISFNTVLDNYLTEVTIHQESIVSGTLQGNLGYLYVADFKGKNDNFQSIFNTIINSFSEKKGLIIDLRENDGGTVYNAQSLLNKLTSQTMLWHTTENRTESGFDNKYEWYITPTGDYQFTKDIVVLTGRYTVSAGERFAIGAKALSHIKIIGDTTANTQGSVMGREMLNGWSYTFTFERVLSPAGINYEGIGIDPDIYIQSDTLDLSSKDVILEKAIFELQ